MREIEAAAITETVARLAVEATHFLPEDVEGAIRDARETERSPLGVQIIDEILENAEIARERMLPLCQDTGTAVVHVELGQDVHVTGGFLLDAINDGIEQGYGEGYLRKSIVAHPFGDRKNTGTNTPGRDSHRDRARRRDPHRLHAQGRGLREHVALPELSAGGGARGRHRLRLRNRGPVRGQSLPAAHHRRRRGGDGGEGDDHRQALALPARSASATPTRRWRRSRASCWRR